MFQERPEKDRPNVKTGGEKGFFVSCLKPKDEKQRMELLRRGYGDKICKPIPALQVEQQKDSDCKYFFDSVTRRLSVSFPDGKTVKYVMNVDPALTVLIGGNGKDRYVSIKDATNVGYIKIDPRDPKGVTIGQLPTGPSIWTNYKAALLPDFVISVQRRQQKSSTVPTEKDKTVPKFLNEDSPRPPVYPGRLPVKPDMFKEHAAWEEWQKTIDADVAYNKWLKEVFSPWAKDVERWGKYQIETHKSAVSIIDASLEAKAEPEAFYRDEARALAQKKQELDKMLTSNEIVVVDFSAMDCGACKKYKPVFYYTAGQKISYQGKEIKFVNFHATSMGSYVGQFFISRDFKKEYGIDDFFPQTVVFKNGRPVGKIKGLTANGADLSQRILNILKGTQ